MNEGALKEIVMATSKESGKATGSSGGSSQKGGSGSSQGPAKRGFAAMDEAQQRQIASKGGQAAHQKGTAHEFDSEEARRAGQKGGEAVSRNRAHMADIGRKGGESRQSAHRAAAAAAAAAKGERQGGEKQ
jgi:general stress protein YciG